MPDHRIWMRILRPTFTLKKATDHLQYRHILDTSLVSYIALSKNNYIKRIDHQNIFKYDTMSVLKKENNIFLVLQYIEKAHGYRGAFSCFNVESQLDKHDYKSLLRRNYNGNFSSRREIDTGWPNIQFKRIVHKYENSILYYDFFTTKCEPEYTNDYSRQRPLIATVTAFNSPMHVPEFIKEEIIREVDLESYQDIWNPIALAKRENLDGLLDDMIIEKLVDAQ